ncbi:MAG: NnrS family protein [Acidobacteriota bacterium]|nr:NnrS family protein [Acidobacteriota bacterium]
MDIARAREQALARVLMAYVSTGLIFMLLPGTFLGVWNLLQISGRESAGSVSPAWLQAHGHAQIFGWIGSFIIGIGFHSIPKRRGDQPPPTRAAWICWVGWTTGVAMRWTANIYPWHWQTLLPVSGVLELGAFLFFFATVSRHRPEDAGQKKLEPWIWAVIAASSGFFLALAANLAACFWLAWRGSSPALPHVLDQRYLALITWGFLVPFIWAFSARWMHIFLGLRPTRTPLLAAAVAVNFAGVASAIFGGEKLAAILLIAGAGLAIAAMRMFEPAIREPKIRGLHASFPYFVRLAYAWMLIAALLEAAAVRWDTSGGFWGASRHALTVGFIAMMVLCVGQRILPAFAGMRLLWSTRLMFAGLLLLGVGCVLRVSSEVLAYQEYAGWAWSVLPISAVLELLGVTSFAVNIFGTFILQPSHAVRQPMTIELEQHASPQVR